MNKQQDISVEESIINAHVDMQAYLNAIRLPIAEKLNIHILSVLCGKMLNVYNDNNVYIYDNISSNFLIPNNTT